MQSREVFWNIQHPWVMYVLAGLAVLCFAWGVWRRSQEWRGGRKDPAQQRPSEPLKRVFSYVVLQKRIMKDRYAGCMHLLISFGMFILLLATVVVFLQSHLGLPVFQGGSYVVVKLFANAFGLAALTGIIMALVRRIGHRQDALETGFDDAFSLVLLALIIVLGFFVQALRMAATEDPWAACGFVGYVLMPLFEGAPFASLALAHKVVWWVHFLLSMVFIAYIPHSKLFHMFSAPANIWKSEQGSTGIMNRLDFMDESVESFGAAGPSDLSRRELFFGVACAHCGRCQNACPAFASGKNLNPQEVLEEIRKASAAGVVEDFIGGCICPDDIWSCTTCRACEEACPVLVGHVDTLLDFRRHLTLDRGEIPREAQHLFRNLEVTGNPWGSDRNLRDDFLRSLGAPLLEEGGTPQMVLWPGCFGALDAQGKKTTKALVKLLREADVDFSFAGSAFGCCGDSARRLGNEYLFDTVAQENADLLQRYGVQCVVVQCPHCLHVLKEEYPAFGSAIPVYHYVDYLAELVSQGRLRIGRAMRVGEGGRISAAYHDPCYLGRYRGSYETPRSLLEKAGLSIIELSHNRSQSLCCGAGGGRMWLEESPEQRVNRLRSQEALQTGADVMVTACPFCESMLSSSFASEEGEQMAVVDLAQILAWGFDGPECLSERVADSPAGTR